MERRTHDADSQTRHPGGRPRFTTTLYDLIATVEDEVRPADDVWIAPLVRHVLRAGHAHFLRDLTAHDLAWDDVESSWQADEILEEGLAYV